MLAALLAVQAIGWVLIGIRLTRLLKEISSTCADMTALVVSLRECQGRDGMRMKNERSE